MDTGKGGYDRMNTLEYAPVVVISLLSSIPQYAWVGLGIYWFLKTARWTYRRISR